jgi:NADH:ubiquinone oxidoreductase subunit K
VFIDFGLKPLKFGCVVGFVGCFFFFVSNYNFVFFSQMLDDVMGQTFSLFILSVAAAESAVGLAIIISYYKFYL